MTATIMSRLPRSLQIVIRVMALIAGGFLLLLTALTVIDITARSIGLFSIYGIIEVSQGTLLLIACFGQPWVFATQGHIVVDLLTSWLPARAARTLDAVGYFLAGLALLVLGWYVAVGGWEMHAVGERSQTLGLSPLLFRIPAALGLFVSAISAIFVAARMRRVPA
ncbi:TRAP transporter small permease subunit [Oricola sp.]|uniref:TRAP transporter small permease n=1 Tax=Oricola sp. TaxID=1979950 RepID=UPI0025FDFCB6|nr:TRAP transporter small permease subunit [Oricola sp.]MCI5074895.1 TRAP transporter small permease [Oricola sp.]